MKRRVIALILVGVMALGLYGCAGVPGGQGDMQASGGMESPAGASLRSRFLSAQEDLYDPGLKPSAAAYTGISATSSTSTNCPTPLATRPKKCS